jgi:hypothetical protein
MYLRFYMIFLTILAGRFALADWDRFEQLDESQSRYYIEQFKDKSKLKKFLMRGEFMWAKEMPLFKSKFKISDEFMRTVSTEIYSETMDKVTHPPQGNNGVASQEDQKLLLISVGWMGTVTDSNTKTFLLGLAKDVSTDVNLKSQAISSYLITADPKEAKAALLRFLVDEGDRMSHMKRLSIYSYARMAYDAASPEKKAAILAALIAAANKEEGKIEFMKVDKILAERSAAYRHSHERLAMLERHSLEPPTNNLYTDRDLKAGLEECRKYKAHTSISTNLAVLKSRDFNLPLPVSATNEVTETASKSIDTKAGAENNQAKKANSIGVLSLIGGGVVLILGLGLWHLSRKR